MVDNGQTPSGTECMSDNECGAGMCCVSYPMDSRRQTQGHHGYCRNERKFNETCDLQGKKYDLRTNSWNFQLTISYIKYR